MHDPAGRYMYRPEAAPHAAPPLLLVGSATTQPSIQEVEPVHPFRAAVEAQDLEAALALLAQDVVFRSPVVFKPYHGRDAVAALLLAVSRVFEDFRYVCEIGALQARDHALVFHARIGDRELDGCDFLHTNERGMIDDFCVMVRPLSGALALAEAMQAQLEAGPGTVNGS